MARRRLLLAAVLCAGSLSLAAPGVASDRPVADGPTASSEVAARVVRQRATLQMHPQIAQPGTAIAAAASARSAMTATFRPRKKGRPVVLQRKQGSRWVKVARARQPRSGRVEFRAPYSRNGQRVTYRVAAARFDGLRPVATRGVSTGVVGDADFVDEFRGSALDSEVWSHRSQHYDARNRQCSKGDPRAVAVSGGRLALRVLDDPDRGNGCDPTLVDGKDKYAWRLNGHVGTDGAYSMRYGYAAARIKFQPESGQHGAFWMMPERSPDTARVGSASSTGAEIDAIEWFGPDSRDGLGNFVHYWPQSEDDPVKVGDRIKDASRFGRGWASSYHVFSVEWTPSRYVFRIDGQETYRTSRGVSGQPEYLILSLLSSDYELHKIRQGDLPQTMSVDWVRTWERPSVS